MSEEFEDIITAAQVSEDFAFDSGESVEADLTLEEIDTPIKALKSVILSIDWEITPEILEKYLQEIQKLEKLWAQDNIALAFLRILSALGNYIKLCQGSSHPDAVKLLYSVYNGLEKCIVSKKMSNAEKVALVQGELRKYNSIRDTIKQANAQVTEESTTSDQSGEAAQSESVESSPADEDLTGPDVSTTKEDFSSIDDEEITPALASVPDSGEDSAPRWSSNEGDHDSDVAGRLSDFFGEDDDDGSHGGSDGVVALSLSDDESPETTSAEDEGEEELEISIDDFDDSAKTQSQKNESLMDSGSESEPEPAADGQADIFDDLFASKPATPADDLLLQMHLPDGKKSETPSQEIESSVQEADSEVQGIEVGQEGTVDSTSSDDEVSQRLDSFFGDDEPSATSGGDIEDGDGVVPLPPTGSDTVDLDGEEELASTENIVVDYGTEGKDDGLAAFSRMQEVLGTIDGPISAEISNDFNESIRAAQEYYEENRAVLMLIEALRSTFSSLNKTGIATSENIGMMNNLCSIAIKATAVRGPSETEVAGEICEGIREYIAFQDTVNNNTSNDK